VTAALPLTAADIHRAQRRLRGVAAATPVLSSPVLDDTAGRPVACKAEALQRTGSFKFRGAYNAVASLGSASRHRGVVGASSGNHAQALALAGRLLAVPVTVVVPRDAPAAKVNGARLLGARVVTYDRHRDDRGEITAGLAAEHGYSVVPSANHPCVMAGAGTVALELLRQAPRLATILVPVGGGGLAAGTAVAAKDINRDITSSASNPSPARTPRHPCGPGTRSRCPPCRTRSPTDCGTPAPPGWPGRSTRCCSTTWSPSPTATSPRP